MEEIYFVHRIKRADGVWDKGIEIKDQGTSLENLESAKQSYHAYLGAYAYKKSETTDYVACYITDVNGVRVMWECWSERQPETVTEES